MAPGNSAPLVPVACDKCLLVLPIPAGEDRLCGCGNRLFADQPAHKRTSGNAAEEQERPSRLQDAVADLCRANRLSLQNAPTSASAAFLELTTNAPTEPNIAVGKDVRSKRAFSLLEYSEVGCLACVAFLIIASIFVDVLFTPASFLWETGLPSLIGLLCVGLAYLFYREWEGDLFPDSSSPGHTQAWLDGLRAAAQKRAGEQPPATQEIGKCGNVAQHPH
jgi:hypothetical protein